MDKAEKFDIEVAEIEGNSIKIPFHSRVVIQCSLKEFYEVGGRCLYISNVEQAYGNDGDRFRLDLLTSILF